MHSQNEGEPGDGFEHEWDVISLTYFPKMCQALLLRTNCKGAGGKTGEPREGVAAIQANGGGLAQVAQRPGQEAAG